jgi:hypothetical protein
MSALFRRDVCLVAIALALVGSCKTHVVAEVVDAATPLPLEGFEGEIDSSGDVSFTFGDKDSGVRTELKVEIKGDKIRVERDARWVTIVDPAAKKTWRFDVTAHTFITDTLAAPPTQTNAKKTGSDTVAGVPCEVWEMDEALGHRTLCIAPGLRKTYMGRAEPTWRGSSDDEALFTKGFPLRDATTAGGQTMWRVETTRIVKRPIPDADFVMPADYKEQPPLGLHVQ